jgi:hypothetical protein
VRKFWKRPDPGLVQAANDVDSWTPTVDGWGRQQHGPIRAPGRNSDLPTSSFQQNRAGRRQYVRENQTRTNRLHLLGFGRWRRHREANYESHAAQTAVAPLRPRWERRLDWAITYRAAKRNQSRRVTPRRLEH